MRLSVSQVFGIAIVDDFGARDIASGSEIAGGSGC